MSRRAGILLHPTSFPGPGGMGRLGDEAKATIDWLASAGMRAWQILPLGPTGYGDSPYQAFSAFAGNPYLLSLERLAQRGYLTPEDLAHANAHDGTPDRIDYGSVIPHQLQALTVAEARFWRDGHPDDHEAVRAFQTREAHWLDGYATFMALKEAHGGAPWSAWPADLRDRNPSALHDAGARHADAIRRHVTWQAWFDEQWSDVRDHAHARGIGIIGDLPIFVAYDSADVWLHRELFDLDERGHPNHVAGVPPDYFSATGQRWGNPLYRWDVMEQEGFAWWRDRLAATLRQVDLVRIDHFRGFESYWEIPAEEPTAVKGAWKPGPGQAFFDALRASFPDLPIIAEDLGVITPDVEALRDANHLPGMKVLQFAFAGDASDPYLPHNYGRNAVVYTGTHDNDTTVGWYANAPERERDHVRRYLASDGTHIALDLLRAAYASVADLVIAPLQDVLERPSEARMNLPGSQTGNWGWRATFEDLDVGRAAWLHELAELYGRVSDGAPRDTPYRQSNLPSD